MSPEHDERRMRGFFVKTVNYIRLLVLMAGGVAKKLYQAERQRGRSVEPRMRRDLHFAIERAATNIALRTISTALVIEEMYGGAPTIYVDYTGYKAIALHCGPERVEAVDALEGIDRAIGSLLKAARYSGRSCGRQDSSHQTRTRFIAPPPRLVTRVLSGVRIRLNTTLPDDPVRPHNP